MNRNKRIVVLAAMLVLVSAAAAYALRGEIVEVALYRSARMVNGVPAGWKIMRHSGTPVIRLEKFGDAYYVRMISDSRSGFGIEKEVSVALKEYPYLNWTWTATKLPRGGDVRRSATDDQALQIYVVLPTTGFPEQLNTPFSPMSGTMRPEGTDHQDSQALMKKIRTLSSATRRTASAPGTRRSGMCTRTSGRSSGTWTAGAPGATHGLRFYINSQNTKSRRKVTSAKSTSANPDDPRISVSRSATQRAGSRRRMPVSFLSSLSRLHPDPVHRPVSLADGSGRRQPRQQQRVISTAFSSRSGVPGRCIRAYPVRVLSAMPTTVSSTSSSACSPFRPTSPWVPQSRVLAQPSPAVRETAPVGGEAESARMGDSLSIEENRVGNAAQPPEGLQDNGAFPEGEEART
jgi:hypothetical protein